MSISKEPLWTVDDLRGYLRRSRRWVYTRLGYASDRPGSIPHLRLAGSRSPRFVPSIIAAWVEQGCPPVNELVLEE
ncbi:MAG: hypothetical protein M9894_20690 [Planctomycetes bacterium]|nr:hypothetical protein [Planctomycetota bacterium]